MKKRQAGLLGLIIGQAVTMVAKDKQLREEVQTAPGFLQKIKLLATKWRETNTTIVEDISEKAKDRDRDKGIETVKSTIHEDSHTLQQWRDEQQAKNREEEGKASVRKIISKAPTQKSLEETLQKYKQKVIERRDTI